MCQEVAACVQDYATSQGIQILPQDLAQASDTQQADDDRSRAFASQGTTKLRLPQLMPEYKQILHVCLPAEVCVWPLKSYLQGPHMIGPHISFLRTPVCCQCSLIQKGLKWHCQQTSALLASRGRRIIKEAALRGHPNSLSLAIPPELKSAIWSLATSPPDQVAQLRAAFFKKWMNKASELHEQELGLKESMDPELKKIVQNKKIIIFEQMINEYQIADKEAPKILSEGVDMAGRIPASDNLPRQFFPATVPEEDLEALGPVLNQAALSRAASANDLTAETWMKTLEERDRGWLAGPFAPCDPECPKLLSNRFGVKQKEKVRCVDDMSASLINSTTFAEEKVSLHSTDVMASAVAEWFRVRTECGKSPKLTAKSFDLSQRTSRSGSLLSQDPFQVWS